MPLEFARRLTGRRRTAQADRQLGFGLAFVAGAINAGGFLAVAQYTSHMTGIVSAMADNLVLGAFDLVLVGLGGLLSFLAGAVCSTVMVNLARQRQLNSEYAFPLLLEAVLLLGFGVLGARLAQVHGLFVPVTVMLLCFIMGLQNAVITKLSGAVIRTTHITGVVTDIGIELGRLLVRSAQFNGAHLHTLVRLALSFFVGGVVGALGFKQLGYFSTVPLALLLVSLAGVPAMDDLLNWLRVWWRAVCVNAPTVVARCRRVIASVAQTASHKTGDDDMTLSHAVVWTDHNAATVQQFDAEQVQVNVQLQKLHAHHHPTPQHGSGVRAEHEFFADICLALEGVAAVLVTGSHTTLADFRHYADKHRPQTALRIVAYEVVDHPSDKQLVALARAYFLKHHSAAAARE
jgi:uncharacterized membrane protein YoaK (UPF0700 family)